MVNSPYNFSDVTLRHLDFPFPTWHNSNLCRIPTLENNHVSHNYILSLSLPYAESQYLLVSFNPLLLSLVYDASDQPI